MFDRTAGALGRASLITAILGLAACGGGAPGGGGQRQPSPSGASPTAVSLPTSSPTAATAASAAASREPTATGPVNGCAVAALDRCEYGSAPRPVTEKLASIPGPTGDRKLPVRVHIPGGAGPFPVVLYSHGGGFDDAGFAFGQAWAEAIAPFGYIVGTIGHATLTPDEGLAMCTAASVPKAECVPGDEDSGLVGYIKMRDVLSVIDALPALARAADGLADSSRLGVIGWSAGSRAAVSTRGAAFRPSAGSPVFSASDARIGALAAFSPTGPGFGGFFDNGASASWTSLQGPTFMSTGDIDVKPNSPTLTGPIRRMAYEKQPADGARRLLYSTLPLGVGGHGTFNLGDLGSRDERLARFSKALRSAVRAFLDANLKGSAVARVWLASDNARILAGQADWVSK